MKTISKKHLNPLLAPTYTPVGLRLVEQFAHEVNARYLEMGPSDDCLYIGFTRNEVVNSNNYELVRKALDHLADCSLIIEHHEMDGREKFISGYRMGKGDGMLVVKIPKEMIPYYRELAAMPHMRYAMLFKSDYDRPLYTLCDAVADILDTTKSHMITVNGKNVEVEPSQAKGKGWLHIRLHPLAQILGIEGNDFYKRDGEYFFAEINRSILKPRFSFLTKNTDLRCEASNRVGRVKVTGIDLRITRQAADAIGVPVSSLSEYQLYALLERLFSDKKQAQKMAERLYQHEIIKLYVTAIASTAVIYNRAEIRRDKRGLKDWATLILAACHPDLGVTHPEIEIADRKINFQKFQKAVA